MPFCGFVVKKVTATMLSLSLYGGGVVEKVMARGGFFFFFGAFGLVH
jgi:hypothetical protein